MSSRRSGEIASAIGGANAGLSRNKAVSHGMKPR